MTCSEQEALSRNYCQSGYLWPTRQITAEVMQEYILFSIFSLAFLAGSLAIARYHRRVMKKCFDRIARYHKGEYRPGQLVWRPSVRLKHQDAHVLINTSSTGGILPRYYTQFHISWPAKDLRCEIFPESALHHIAKRFLEIRDVEIGQPEFDSQYVIRGNDDAAARELLTSEVRSLINNMRWFWRTDDVYVVFKGGTLQVRKRGLLRDYLKLSQFLSMFLDLFDWALIAKPAVVEFVEEQWSIPQEITTVCQICGETMSGNIVYCKSCKTPHHLDCWQYSRKCSTYGCGQTKYQLPPPAK